MRAWIVVPVLAVGLGGCVPKQSTPAPPPPPKLKAIERPDDVLGEILVRDPLALVEQIAQTPGSKTGDPLGLLKSPEIAPIAEVVDMHGCAAFAMFGEPKQIDSWHGAGAVRLKDPKGARAKFAEAAAQGKFTVSENPNIRAKVYVSGKSNLALIGETLVVSDSATVLESAGRWIAKETEGTPTHEVSLHVPLARFAGQLKGEAKALLDKEVGKDPDSAAFEPLARQVVDLIGDLGDVSLSLDIEKQDAVVDFKLGASGGFSEWLSKYPAGTPRTLLTLPRGNGAGLVRWPSSLTQTLKSFLDEPLKTKPSKEVEDFRAFAKTIGTEVAFVYTQKPRKDGGSPKLNELLVRLELTDPAGAKAALKTAITDVGGKPDHKITRSPWSKFGADGESLTIVQPSERIEARWAIKGNALFFDFNDDGKVTLIDAALDPNNKSLLGNDLRAKSFVEKLPKQGLALAFYSQSPAAPKPEELGAVPGLDGIRWGWVSAAATGVASMWNLPLLDFANAAGESKL